MVTKRGAKKYAPNKRTGKITKKELNEMVKKYISDIELKKIVIRMLKELSENYNSMKKDIEIMKKNH